MGCFLENVWILALWKPRISSELFRVFFPASCPGKSLLTIDFQSQILRNEICDVFLIRKMVIPWYPWDGTFNHQSHNIPYMYIYIIPYIITGYLLGISPFKGLLRGWNTPQGYHHHFPDGFPWRLEDLVWKSRVLKDTVTSQDRLQAGRRPGWDGTGRPLAKKTTYINYWQLFVRDRGSLFHALWKNPSRHNRVS